MALNLDYRISYQFIVILHDKKLLLLLVRVQHLDFSLTVGYYDSNLSMVQVKGVLDKRNSKEAILIMNRHDLN